MSISGHLIHDDGMEERHPVAKLLADLLDRMLPLLLARPSKFGRPAAFSAIHFSAKTPSWISSRIFFISARVASVTMRGPAV